LKNKIRVENKIEGGWASSLGFLEIMEEMSI
jgi:hypothetical protein